MHSKIVKPARNLAVVALGAVALATPQLASAEDAAAGTNTTINVFKEKTMQQKVRPGMKEAGTNTTINVFKEKGAMQQKVKPGMKEAGTNTTINVFKEKTPGQMQQQRGLVVNTSPTVINASGRSSCLPT